MAIYSKKRITAMLRAIDEAPNTDVKGEALESLSRYLLEKVRGVEFQEKNILDSARAHELDIAFWNDQPNSELFFLDAILIVECKASALPVGSSEVGWFVRKLQDHGAQHGIFVALNGVTGNMAMQTGTSAHSEILGALNRDKIKILLITRSEIEALTSSSDLAGLLKRKLLRLALARTVHVAD